MLLTVDEIQYLKLDDLTSIIMGLHRVPQEGLPFLLAGAGLPTLLGLAGEARAYSELLFHFVEVDSLSDEEAREALVGPVEDEGQGWEPEAVERVIESTGGYPYLIQEFGKQAWNVADGPVITRADSEAAGAIAIIELDRGFFRARIDRTTDSERNYLKAMAGLPGTGPYRSGDVSAALDKTTSRTGPTRDALIKRGLIYSPRHGDIAFTVPLFAEFMHRRFSWAPLEFTYLSVPLCIM